MGQPGLHEQFPVETLDTKAQVSFVVGDLSCMLSHMEGLNDFLNDPMTPAGKGQLETCTWSLLDSALCVISFC